MPMGGAGTRFFDNGYAKVRENTIQQIGNEISFKDKVNVELPDSSLEIYYICDNPRARSKKWLIYKQ